MVLMAALLALLPVALPSVALAQEEAGTVTITSATPLRDVVGVRNVWMPALSPDGASLAYYNQDGGRRGRDHQMCVFSFETEESVCSLMPEEFRPFPYMLQWSPDSTLIAFSENPVELGNESDIWIYDVAATTFSNLTDDGITGSWRRAESAELNLDYVPMWNPADGSLLFWRLSPLGNLQYDLGIFSVDPAGGNAELVVDVSESMAGFVPFFRTDEIALDGPSGVSPDGLAVAVLMRSLNDLGATASSLWLIDLGGVIDEPVLALDAEGLRAGLPEWQSFPPTARGLSWTADSATVVTLSTSPSVQTPFTLLHSVDVATLETTPVVDFSGLPDARSYFDIAEGSTLPWRAYSPWTASLTSAGDALLMVNDLTGIAGVFQAALPAQGDLPTVIAYTERVNSNMSTRASRSVDGKVVVYGALLITEQ
jgi:hypothetical protein